MSVLWQSYTVFLFSFASWQRIVVLNKFLSWGQKCPILTSLRHLTAPRPTI